MGMNATRRLTGLAIVAALCLVLTSMRALAQAPAVGQDAAAKGPKYTQAEYNAEQACAAEKVPAAVIKCADDFVAKYPNSDLLVYIYPLYYQAYSAQKNYSKMIEIADRLAALGDKVALGLNPDDLTSNYRRGQAYLCMNPPQQMDAFWSIARAVTAKGATQAQAAKVKDYLRKLIANYQGGTVCDSLTDAELNELL